MSKKIKKAVIIIVLLLLVDLGTKLVAQNILENNTIEVIKNFFYLDLYYNSGAAFGMLENARWFFIGLTAIILSVGWKYFSDYHLQSAYIYYGGILFFAGTLGNFFERLLVGEVTDFLSFIFGSYRFAIFNFADVFLTMSVPVIVIGVYLYEKNLEEASEN